MLYAARENEPPLNCRKRLGLFLLNFVLLGAVPLRAQLLPNLTPPPPSAAAASPATTPPAPLPISASDIPERLRQAANIVRAANGRATPLAEVKTIESQLPELTNGIADLAKWSRSRLGSEDGKPESLSGLRLIWEVNRQRLDAWQTLLKERSSALQQDNAALQAESAAWSVTSDVAYDQQIPDEIIAQITQTIQDVAESQQAVVARRNEVLKLQHRVSALRIEIDKVTDELTAEAGRQRGGLFRLDSAPVWSAAPTGGTGPAQSGKPVGTLPVTAVVKYYVLSLLVLIGLQITAFVVVVVGLFLLRRRAAAWVRDEDQAVKALGLVVKRPLSSALLLTVLVGAIYHPNAPQSLANAAWYLMLIPLLRLIPGIIAPKNKAALWLLAGLYTADGVLATVPKYNLSARIAALILAAAAGAALVWLDRQLRTRREPGAWLNLGLGFVRIGIVALVVAFGCELFGATTLARFLESGVLRVLYGAVLLYAATLTLRGFMQVALRSRPLQSAMSATESPHDLMRRFSSGLNYFGVAVFTLLVVNSFALLEPLTTMLSRLLTRQISVGAVEFSLGGAAVFVAVLVAASLLSKLLRFLLSIGIYSQIELQRGQSAAISKLLHYSVITLGFLLALGAAGIELSKFVVFAGAFGVGLGLGMQNIVNNFVAGLILLFERPLKVGDKITMGSTSGQVLDIGIRTSTIRTWDGADVLLPNANLISNDLTNWTLTDEHRRGQLQIGVACGTDPERVLRVLQETALEQELILKDPAPSPVFVRFGESSLDFVLFFWTRFEDFVAAGSSLHVAVNNRLAREGIEIPFPARDLYLRSSGSNASGWPEAKQAMPIHERR